MDIVSSLSKLAYAYDLCLCLLIQENIYVQLVGMCVQGTEKEFVVKDDALALLCPGAGC